MSYRFQPYSRPGSAIPTHDNASGLSSHAPSRSGSFSSSSYNSPAQTGSFNLPPLNDFSTSGLARDQLPPNASMANNWSLPGLENGGLDVDARQTALSGYAAAADVERLAGRLAVPSAQLLQFNTLPVADKLVAIYGLLLRQQQDGDDVRTSVANLDTKVTSIQENMTRYFKPSDTAMAHMRRTARHYLLKSVRAYLKLHDYTRDFYVSQPTGLETTLYPSDSKVKATINKTLREVASQARSNMRKLVWRFVKNRTELASWGIYMLDHYWSGGQRPDEVPLMLKARLALMRDVALPLVDKPSVKGQNTMFWKFLDNRLAKLYTENGDPKSSRAWQQWAEQIVAQDKAKFKEVPIGELPPPDDDEDDDFDLD